jgi:hypothetical protein
VLNANTWNANRAGQARGPFIWNPAGRDRQRPVYIPKVYDGRNKTFFLFSWEAIQAEPAQRQPGYGSTRRRIARVTSLPCTRPTARPSPIYDPLVTGLGGSANVRVAIRRQ